jgi:hypothetical protein
MIEIIKFLFGCVGTISLLCLVLFAFHAHWKRDWLAAVLEKEWKAWSFITRIYLSLAALGFIACVYFGTYGLLWWMPSDWGRHNEDGDFSSVREYLSCASIFFLGFPLIGLIWKEMLEVAKTKRLETRFHAAETSSAELSKQLEVHKAIVESLREQIESLRSKSDR